MIQNLDSSSSNANHQHAVCVELMCHPGYPCLQPEKGIYLFICLVEIKSLLKISYIIKGLKAIIY